MNRFFLHVGYPKTGTTTLQLNLFRNHQQLHSFREQYKQIENVKKEICKNISPEIRSMKNNVKEVVGNSDKKVGVYSEEVFTSNLKNRGPDSINRSSVAKRLRKVFRFRNIDTEVIIVIREQKSFLISLFQFYYHKYKSLGYKSIDDLVRNGTEKNDRRAYKILSWPLYFDTINSYKNCFGKSNVHILLYESMKKNQEEFVAKLSNIMGINPNESVQLLESSTDRNVIGTNTERRAPSKMYHRLSVFKSTYLSNIGSVRSFAIGRWFVDWMKKGGSKISLSETSRSRLNTFYVENNRKLEKEFGLPLRENGYSVSGAD
jgi:hypothetical protein